MDFKKIIAVAVMLCLAFSAAGLCSTRAVAADNADSAETAEATSEIESDGYFDVSYEATEAYKNSKYYENLNKIPRSGNQAIDTVAVALSQVGYHEGNGEADFHGMNVGGTGDFVEYNMIFGKVDKKVGYGYAWCASFATWCLRQAGVTVEQTAQADSHSYISCRKWLAGLEEAGRYHSVEDGYTPIVGDLIFFKDVDDPTVKTNTTHVGIVLYSDEEYVYTVEGNTNSKMGKEKVTDSVTVKTHELDSKYIVGYGSPDYEDSLGEDLLGWDLVSNTDSAPEPLYELFDEIRAGGVAVPVFEGDVDIDPVQIVGVVLVSLALVSGIVTLAVMTFKKKPDDKNSGRRRESQKSRNKYSGKNKGSRQK